MEPIYKIGDRVILTTDTKLLSATGVSDRYAGCEAIIEIIKSFPFRIDKGIVYCATIINKGGRKDAGWNILERQIIGLKEIDWEKRLRRCNDA
jgi:hypothetical protein